MSFWILIASLILAPLTQTDLRLIGYLGVATFVIMILWGIVALIGLKTVAALIVFGIIIAVIAAKK